MPGGVFELNWCRMELIRGLYNLAAHHRGCVASIGNFDGLHLGHQKVIEQLARRGSALKLPTLIITFEPHPQAFFTRGRGPAQLLRWRDKLALFEGYGVDRVFVLRFDERFSQTSAEGFMQNYLVDGIGVSHVVVGDDFRFGCNRRGDFEMLSAFGRQYGFDVAHMDTHYIDGERVSSTRVRSALEAGDLTMVQRLLGRPYCISGHIAHGEKIGRKLGFPTANINLGFSNIPLSGIFAVRVHGLEQGVQLGAANVGYRPAVGGNKPKLEVFLLEFDADIYGRLIEVEFLHKIRDERNFPSLDALKDAIAGDIEAIKDYFASPAFNPVR